MSKDTIVRLSTPTGRSRLSLPTGATFSDLQLQIKTHTGVDPTEQRLSFDPAGRQLVAGAAGALIGACGISNGAQIHLLNKESATVPQILTKVPVPAAAEEPISKSGAGGSAAPAQPSSSSASAGSAAPAAPVAASPASGGSAANDAGGSGAGQKIVLPKDDKVLQLNPKFQPFEKFLKFRRYDIASLPGSQKFLSVKKEMGKMNKIPPSISVKQQHYRHVDTLHMMNREEIFNFVGYWHNELLENILQRFGWMYGYYLEENPKYYEDGCRAVLEAIYEPPQQMGSETATLDADPHQQRVDRIAEALGLEKIGCIFTSLPLDDGVFLSPNEVQRIARLQMEHSTDAHFTKYRVSKFVSCSVRPDTERGGEPKTEVFQVSDQCCAMVRDGLFKMSQDQRHLEVQEPGKDYFVPQILVESKPSEKIVTDFFVVRCVDSAPKTPRSIFTHADFPRENRPTQPQRRQNLSDYFRKRDKSEPSWSRFADFHLLLYLAQEIDVTTAEAICECVRERKEIPDGVMMLLEGIMR